MFTNEQRKRAEELFLRKMEMECFAHYEDDERLQALLYNDCLNQFANADELSSR